MSRHNIRPPPLCRAALFSRSGILFPSDLRDPLFGDFADYAASGNAPASPRECNGNASDTCFGSSILLARMTRLASPGPKQWSSRVTRSLSFYKIDSPRAFWPVIIDYNMRNILQTMTAEVIIRVTRQLHVFKHRYVAVNKLMRQLFKKGSFILS